MTNLWVPPGSDPLFDAAVPDQSSIVLCPGRTLQRIDKWLVRDESGICSQGAKYQEYKGLNVIASMDDTTHSGMGHGRLLHVSLSYPDRLPTWEDVRLVKDAFFGDLIDAMMVLPRKEDYVNTHPYCFHLWQTPKTWGLR